MTQETTTRPGWVYFAYAPLLHRCKIGWTDSTPQKRLASATDSPDVINIWGMLCAFQPMERLLHHHFRYLRIKGEWFAVDEHLRRFVQGHTYAEPEATSCSKWTDSQWADWDRVSQDSHTRTLISWCQENPVYLCQRSPNPVDFFHSEIEPWISSWFGHHVAFEADDFKKSERAYDVVSDMCLDLLPR